ncbi:telomerase-binding protein EST1A protein [Apiospora arundinis]
MVESKCIEVDNAQNTQKDAKLNNEQWQALIALHRTLLHEHHDFFLASQHPTASSSLRRLGAKYYMPGRMWKHGIHAFLELLRHRLPDSLEHMLTFIYLAYSMMALLYETVPAFEATWMECLGDLGRYRMAIEDDDIRDREVWTAVSRRWYSKASDVVPGTGRLYHHLAILARPNVLQQLYFYSKALSAPDPFFAALDSIMTLFDPLLSSNKQQSRLLPIDFAYVKAHALLFAGKTGSDYNTAVAEFVDNLDHHISRTTRRWMECGYFIAISNCCALLSWGKNSFIYQTIRPRGPKESIEDFNTREVPDPSEQRNAKRLEEARHLAEGTYDKVFSRFADPNILPFLHSTLVFYRFLISYPAAMSLLEATFPWKLVSMLLNSLLSSYRGYERIQSNEFPRPVKQLPRPLPEDFALRGLLWADKYYPSDWFSNDKIDDDEKYFEVASMTDERKERVLWLGVTIAQHGKWLLYDENTHQFSVPSRFDQDIDINMNLDTQMTSISGADTLSRASTLALSSSGDKASGEAEKDDQDMPDIDDFMMSQPIIRQ